MKTEKTTKKDSPKTSTPNSAFADETITTLDGEEILACSALSLNHQRVLGAKKGSEDETVQNVLQDLLTSLSRNPRHLCVSGPETDKAKQLAELIKPININDGVRKNVLKMKPGDKLPELWVELVPVLEDWQKRQAKNATEQAKADAKAKELAAKKAADDKAKAKADAEKRRKQAEADAKKAKEQAEGLAAFVSPDVQAANAERKAQAEQNEFVRQQRKEWLLPFLQGYAVVNDNRNPTRLSVTDENGENPSERPLLSFHELVEEVNRLGGNAEEVEVECAFCGAKHKLEEATTYQRWNKETEQKEPVAINKARQVWVPCRTAMYERDGEMVGGEQFVNLGGPRKGQPKSVPISCCIECANVARELSRELGLKNVWVQDIWPAFCNFRERAAEEQRKDVARLGNKPRFRRDNRARQ